MSKLFVHYDKEKSGFQEGQEFKSLLRDLTEYFFAMVEAQHPGTHKKEQVWNWLKPDCTGDRTTGVRSMR